MFSCASLHYVITILDIFFKIFKFIINFYFFTSKLARIINEQGRPQLAKGWGSAESPECKGFTPEEFQKLDFSKIDMSEFFGEIQQNFNVNFMQNQQNFIQNRITNNMNNISGN
ncbi:hypothetical protein CEP74_06175 [Campylobacter jejuni subsp. doylei]|uniref:Uncharacterized protein n=1 Tax=Campylobacter jejuni subsp. doylei TaxID=32021 RepID=A0AAD0HBQ9_CAMJU|nr:hypothetical protein CEP74_06175 [Campylobacter jejuni subsp. doylei]